MQVDKSACSIINKSLAIQCGNLAKVAQGTGNQIVWVHNPASNNNHSHYCISSEAYLLLHEHCKYV